MARIPMSTPRAARAQLAKEIRAYLKTPEIKRKPRDLAAKTQAFYVLLRFLELEERQQHDLMDEIHNINAPKKEEVRMDAVRDAVAEVVASGDGEKARDIVDRAIAAGIITERTPIYPGDLSDMFRLFGPGSENGKLTSHDIEKL